MNVLPLVVLSFVVAFGWGCLTVHVRDVMRRRVRN
jgi:hypothetical protein